jgi:two-component system sensor histidine kinase KdpD
MPSKASARPLGEGRLALLGRLAAVALAVGVTTAVIFPLREIAPAVSTGVVYLLGVLIVSIYCGLAYGLLTSVLSAAAFNFFHISPTWHLEIADGENWVALGVFLISAMIASSVAEQARTRAEEAEMRRREADLAAQMASSLLESTDVRSTLRGTAEGLAEALDLSWAAIELGEAEREGAIAFPLSRGDRPLGTLLVPAEARPDPRARIESRIVPWLETLLAAALDREELIRVAVETRSLRRSDEVKTALLRAVSHDLRSPITAILAAGDALESPGLQQEDRRQLSTAVVAEAARLSDLVDKLLDLSRLEAEQAQPRRDWCSIEEVVSAAVDELGEDAGPVKMALDADLPYVRADAAQLERAIANLLENAVRFSSGRPAIVKGRALEDRLVLRVVDQGPGIPPGELDQVFEPFYRRDDGRRHLGAGLGLAIVRGFIEVNGGHVWAESVPGQGTTFVVELPLERTAAAASSEGA